jgi:hypothetical protein
LEEIAVDWLAGSVGTLFVLLALVMFVLHLLVEREKPAAGREWPDALRRGWGEAAHLGAGGLLLVALAVFMVDADTGLRVVIVPLGTFGAAAPLVHLVAGWRAERDGSPRGERVAGRGRPLGQNHDVLLLRLRRRLRAVFCHFHRGEVG